jgi:hypothetical protein
VSRARIKIPLPSVCLHCRTTIHAVDFVRLRNRKEKTTLAERIVWVHDAPLSLVCQRIRPHSAVPDPAYAPGRARYVPYGPEQDLTYREKIGASVLA